MPTVKKATGGNKGVLPAKILPETPSAPVARALGRKTSENNRLKAAPLPEPGRTGLLLVKQEALFKEQVTHAVIARRAYEIFLSRGATHGHDQEDWAQAEQDVRKYLGKHE